MTGFTMIKIISFFLIFSIHTISGTIVNTTQFDNFTIEWEDFSLLTCAVPTRINISLFTCLPSATYRYVDDITCLNETTIDFDQNSCQITTTAFMYTSSIPQTTQKVTTMASTTTTTTIHTTTQPITTKTAAITTQSTTTTINLTGQTSTSTTTGTAFTSTTTTAATTHSVTTTTTVINAGGTSGVAITSTTATSTTTSAINYTSAGIVTTASSILNTTTATVTGSSDTNTTVITTGASNINTATTTTSSSSNSTVSTTTSSSSNSTATTTTSSSSNSTTTTELTTTTTANIYSCSTDEYIGTYCNVSSDACAMSQPCLNALSCFPNNSYPYGYQCSCQPGYSGPDCERDERACTENTCWHNGTCVPVNATVSSTNGSNFKCECIEGYNGVYCELKIDFCGNITCKNKGVCFTIELMWQCICLDSSLYYGDYCQFKTSKLKLREILSKSFASIAIGAMITTCTFVVIMDLLKYAFHIDPVEYERESYRKRRDDRKRARQPEKNNELKLALRFQYVS